MQDRSEFSTRTNTEPDHAVMQRENEHLSTTDNGPELTAAEREIVLKQFNQTTVAYPQDQLIHVLFEGQARRTPEAVAVVYEGKTLTYAELNGRANQLALHLKDKGVGTDQLVGICIERSLEMVVGLLGILKAGGAYVPLDPGYPAERLAYMLSDVAPRVILIQERLRDRLPATTAAEVIELDHDWSAIAQQSSANLEASTLGLHSRHLAYVIYTSGSTGNPKGAMNEHRGVVNRLQWAQDQYRLGPDDRVLQKTPFSFDVSVWEFFWTLMSGARLVVARPEGHRDPTYLRKLIEETGVTTLHFVPSMLQTFLDQHRSGDCSSLRHVVCSGEELSVALQRKCFECLPQASLSNLYGPTETAVEVTAWECRPEDKSSRVPIGRPIANIKMYLLDHHGQPVPIGVAGEIYIGGVAVGRGYLNRPELTLERFLPDPFSADPQARMYKTGDLGRWRPDGNIEYLGRNDFQVKIRGFRVELGELEAALQSFPGVRRAVAVAREETPGVKRLVGYVVPELPRPEGLRHGDDNAAGEDTTSGLIQRLRDYVKGKLPPYMVPAIIVPLDDLPLTPNGKVDRQALPEPEGRQQLSQRYVAPSTVMEETLSAIWERALRVERVGVQDNFFELGGDSLLGIETIGRIADTLNVGLHFMALLQYPTVRELALFVDELLAEDGNRSASNIFTV